MLNFKVSKFAKNAWFEFQLVGNNFKMYLGEMIKKIPYYEGISLYLRIRYFPICNLIIKQTQS